MEDDIKIIKPKRIGTDDLINVLSNNRVSDRPCLVIEDVGEDSSMALTKAALMAEQQGVELIQVNDLPKPNKSFEDTIKEDIQPMMENIKLLDKRFNKYVDSLDKSKHSVSSVCKQKQVEKRHKKNKNKKTHRNKKR